MHSDTEQPGRNGIEMRGCEERRGTRYSGQNLRNIV